MLTVSLIITQFWFNTDHINLGNAVTKRARSLYVRPYGNTVPSSVSICLYLKLSIDLSRVAYHNFVNKSNIEEGNYDDFSR